MKLVYVADLHGNEILYDKLIRFLKKNRSINALIIGGDLCPHPAGNPEEGIRQQKKFIEKFLIPKLKEIDIPVYLMMGNDDFKVNMGILEKGPFKILHNNKFKLNGMFIVGYSYVSGLPFLMKDWEKMDSKDSKPLTDERLDIRSVKKEAGTIEDDMKKLKKVSDPKKTVYVFHCPPYETNLDMVNKDMHVGSKSIRKFIEEEQPLLTLHGHIHESVEASGEYTDRIGNTICANPGSYHLENLLTALVIDLENLEIEHEMI